MQIYRHDVITIGNLCGTKVGTQGHSHREKLMAGVGNTCISPPWDTDLNRGGEETTK